MAAVLVVAEPAAYVVSQGGECAIMDMSINRN